MAKMKREELLRHLKSCGAAGDKATFTRLYIEHRISLQVANEQWREGVKFGQFIAQRDKETV